MLRGKDRLFQLVSQSVSQSLWKGHSFSSSHTIRSSTKDLVVAASYWRHRQTDRPNQPTNQPTAVLWKERKKKSKTLGSLLHIGWWWSFLRYWQSFSFCSQTHSSVTTTTATATATSKDRPSDWSECMNALRRRRRRRRRRKVSKQASQSVCHREKRSHNLSSWKSQNFFSSAPCDAMVRTYVRTSAASLAAA